MFQAFIEFLKALEAEKKGVEVNDKRETRTDDVTC